MARFFGILNQQVAAHGRGIDRKRSIRLSDDAGRKVSIDLSAPPASFADDAFYSHASEGITVRRSEPFGNGDGTKAATDTLGGDAAATLVRLAGMNESELTAALKNAEKTNAEPVAAK